MRIKFSNRAGQRQDGSPGWRQYYRWARCAKAHLGEIHGHMVGTAIPSSSGRLGILCVFRRPAMQPGLQTGSRWGGRRLADFIFSNRRLSPTFRWPAHPRTPLRVRAGGPNLQSSTPVMSKPFPKAGNWTQIGGELGLAELRIFAGSGKPKPLGEGLFFGLGVLFCFSLQLSLFCPARPGSQ